VKRGQNKAINVSEREREREGMEVLNSSAAQ
jgi:hypothetical protein